MKKNNIAIMIVVGYPSTMKIEINYPPITFTIRVYANKQSLNILYIYIRDVYDAIMVYLAHSKVKVK